MKVELKHHTGWRSYDVPAESLGEAAYLAVRQSCAFLTDDNHTHQLHESTTTWGGQVIPFTSVHIMRNEKSTPYTGPKWAETSYWIAVQYRAPGAAVAPTVEDLVRTKREAAITSVDPAQEGADSTATAVVDVNQGKPAVRASRTRRGSSKKAAVPPAG
jgi:hypothetical protein